MDNIKRNRPEIGSKEEQQTIAILTKAMKYYLTKKYGKKVDAVIAAQNDTGILNPMLPAQNAFVKYMTQLEDIHNNNGKYEAPAKNTSKTIILKKVYEDVYGEKINDNTDKQISFSNADIEKKVSVKALIPQEDVATYDDGKLNEQKETPEIECEEQTADLKVLQPSKESKENLTICDSGLSAKDKKELAMYAIDQHYFFLKQLTGVI